MSPPRPSTLLLLSGAALALVTVVLAAALAPDAPATPIVGTSGQVSGYLAGMAMCALVALHTRGRARTTWVVFAVALACWAATDVVYAASLISGADVPEVSPLDIGWLTGSFLLLVGAVGVYARLRPEHGWQGALDGASLALALSIFAWTLVIGPASEGGSGGVLGTAVNLLYPAFAMAGLVGIGWIVARAGRQSPAWLVWVLVAFGLDTIGETAYLLGALNDAGVSEAVSWVAFTASGWCWALAAGARLDAPQRVWFAGRQTAPPAWSRAVPPLVGLAVIGLLVPGRGVVGMLALVTVIVVAGRLATTLRVNDRLMAEREEMAMTDPLTGALNRRRLDDELLVLDARARRGAGPLSAIALDIDRFKAINDTFGHSAGDSLLILVATTAGRTLRQGDVLFRIGGDEFLILLPGASGDEARHVAERVREGVTRAARDLFADASVTVSLGIAAGPREGGPRALLEAADAALYRAKESGRDRVALDGVPAVARTGSTPGA